MYLISQISSKEREKFLCRFNTHNNW